MDAVINHQRAQALDKRCQVTSTVVSSGPLRNDADHDAAVTLLHVLLDADAGEACHVLADRAAALGESIGKYDAQHHPLPGATAAKVLRFLLTKHDLKRIDLAAEIVSQGVVSEVLHGKRMLNLRPVRALAQRSHVPVAAFIGAQQDAAA